MEGLNRPERNTLRHAIMRAEENKLISQSEAGFIVTLVERFRQDIELKQKKIMVMQGEVAQLQANEKIIIQMIQNIAAAAERDKARRETLARIKGINTEEVTDEESEALADKELEEELKTDINPGE